MSRQNGNGVNSLSAFFPILDVLINNFRYIFEKIHNITPRAYRLGPNHGKVQSATVHIHAYLCIYHTIPIMSERALAKPAPLDLILTLSFLPQTIPTRLGKERIEAQNGTVKRGKIGQTAPPVHFIYYLHFHVLYIQPSVAIHLHFIQQAFYLHDQHLLLCSLLLSPSI